MYRSLALASAIAIAVLLSAVAWSAPTGLVVIPTADVLDPDTACLDWFHEGTDVFQGDEMDSFLGLQMSWDERVEFGVDMWHEGSDGPWANIKWQVVAEDEGKTPAIALGMQGVADGYKPSYYAVASHQLADNLRVHFGATYADEVTLGMVGVEVPVNSIEGLTLCADWVSSGDGMASVGFDYGAGDFWSLMGGRIFYRESGADDTWYLDLCYTFNTK